MLPHSALCARRRSTARTEDLSVHDTLLWQNHTPCPKMTRPAPPLLQSSQPGSLAFSFSLLAFSRCQPWDWPGRLQAPRREGRQGPHDRPLHKGPGAGVQCAQRRRIRGQIAGVWQGAVCSRIGGRHSKSYCHTARLTLPTVTSVCAYHQTAFFKHDVTKVRFGLRGRRRDEAHPRTHPLT